MSRFRNRVVLIFSVLIFQSCILKEFKGELVHLKKDWEMEIIVPMFYGEFQFGDLVHDWDTIPENKNEPVTVLKFSPDSFITIPTRMIFEPAVIIDGFNFLIDGDDYVSSADFIYTVNNSAPFALNFGMRFYEKISPEEKGPVILPPSFDKGFCENSTFSSAETEYTIPLSGEQLESFKAANRIEFSSWFEIPDTDQHFDTLTATQPIKISVVFSGKIHGEYQ